jgi:hypothetical protein
MGKLVKELILTANISGLTEVEKINKETAIANAHQANPLLVPGLNPTPASVITLINTQNGYLTQREALREQLKQLTAEIHAGDVNLNNIFVNQWRFQAQTAIGSDESKAKLLGWGIKNIDSGHTPTSVALGKEIVLASLPVIVKIELNSHLLHILHIHNNITGKRALPKGMLRTDIYAQIAGTMPADYSLMGRALGQASRGKFVTPAYPLADVGKIVYYIAVYVDKKTKQPVAQSVVASAIIN